MQTEKEPGPLVTKEPSRMPRWLLSGTYMLRDNETRPVKPQVLIAEPSTDWFKVAFHS